MTAAENQPDMNPLEKRLFTALTDVRVNDAIALEKQRCKEHWFPEGEVDRTAPEYQKYMDDISQWQAVRDAVIYARKNRRKPESITVMRAALAGIKKHAEALVWDALGTLPENADARGPEIEHVRAITAHWREVIWVIEDATE